MPVASAGSELQAARVSQGGGQARHKPEHLQLVHTWCWKADDALVREQVVQEGWHIVQSLWAAQVQQQHANSLCGSLARLLGAGAGPLEHCALRACEGCTAVGLGSTGGRERLLLPDGDRTLSRSLPAEWQGSALGSRAGGQTGAVHPPAHRC